MSFVMIATGATSRSKVRTVPMGAVLAATALVALMLLGAGGALGYWLAVPSLLPQLASSGAPVAVAPQRPHAALPFALEQLGALSGRLFRLESQAAQLSKRIGILQKDEPAGRDKKTAGNEKTPASGGPLLPPRPLPEDLSELDSQIARLEAQIAAVSDATAEKNLDQMRLPTRLPVRGAELTSTFGNRQDPIANRHAFHAGLDFAAERGTPITASAGGRVVFAGFRSDFGWMVEIEHGNGLTTRYAHASKLLVQQGAVVTPGERIATVGSTGRSTGPHLHFEVLRRGGHLDPKQYLAGI
jgi:murein DD-endopeptidase MepM/ murein hydrolase activator NlpD